MISVCPHRLSETKFAATCRSFSGGRQAACGLLADLDTILADPVSYRHLPQEAWAFDPSLGACRKVRWTNPREPHAVRRTALAVARLEAISRQWELN